MVLLPSSLLREAVPVLYTSLAGHSHLFALPGRNRARRWSFKRQEGKRYSPPYLIKTNTMKTLYSTPPTPGASCPLHLDSPVYY